MGQNFAAITVQGKAISVPTSSNLAAIDTATTLIAAPTSVISDIWAQVPGSMALNGNYTGLYAFRQYHSPIARSEHSFLYSLQH
jgi:cathepsin D